MPRAMRAEPDANGCPPPRQATSDAVGGKGTPALHEKMIRVGGFSDGEARPQRLNRPWTKIDKRSCWSLAWRTQSRRAAMSTSCDVAGNGPGLSPGREPMIDPRVDVRAGQVAPCSHGHDAMHKARTRVKWAASAYVGVRRTSGRYPRLCTCLYSRSRGRVQGGSGVR